MNLLAAAAALAAGLLAARLGERRESAQGAHIEALERKVADRCRKRPGLAWTAGLQPEHFLSSPPPEDLSPPPTGSNIPRRDLLLAAALREEARERGAEAVYLPSASTRREASAIATLVCVAGAAAALQASARGALPAAAVVVLAAAAAVISYVDCRTYLIDLPVAAAGAVTVSALLGAAEWSAGRSLSGLAGAFVAAAAAAATYSALGSAALLARRARESGGFGPPIALLFGTVLAFAPIYLLALRGLVSEPAGPIGWAYAVAPLVAVAYLGRRRVTAGNLRRDTDGRVVLADGPTAGVGDGDLLLMPLVVIPPVALAGMSTLPLLLGLPAALALVGMLVRRLYGRSSGKDPFPFAPALLLASLLAIALSDRIPGLL